MHPIDGMSDESAPVSNWRRFAVLFAKLAFSIALLVVLFSQVDGERLWAATRQASIPWLVAAIGVYSLNVMASTWRWHLLLEAQDVNLTRRALFNSFLVANFFNNFLPSNIGGDVIRIKDTAGAARSKTLAATVVLVDRGLGLLGLVLIAAAGASMAVGLHGYGVLPIWPSSLWGVFVAGAAITVPAMYAPKGLQRLVRMLSWLDHEWVGDRIQTLTLTLDRFREKPASLLGCFAGAVVVQALLVLFYVAVVHALRVPITPMDLALIVPLSLIVQMLPVSVNGFGVREATFSFYFTRIGLPIESAVLVSLVGVGLMMIFSLSGAAVYVSRGR
ncbi:MAG: lysylphosphatidylglycerol synthase transmembrane domain-containing protein [Vicinamibacterales bacterium]